MALPLRIIGTTGASGGSAEVPEVQTGSRQITEASLSRSSEAIQQAGEAMQRSLVIQQETSAAVNAAAAQRRGASPRFTEALDSLAKAAGVFGEMFGARQEQQQEMQAQLDKSLSEQQQVFAIQALQPVVENARAIIQQEGYEKGVPRVREMAIKALSTFENLSPETVQSLMNGIFSDLNRINEDMWNEGQRNVREAREAATSVALERGKILVTTITAELAERGAYLSPTRNYELIREAEQAFTEMPEFLALSPINQAQMRADMYRFIGNAYEQGSRAQQELMSQAENFETAATMLQNVQIAYDTGQISAEQRQLDIQNINLLYGTNITPWGFQDELTNRLEESRVYGEYMELQQQQMYDANPLASLEVGRAVAAIMTGTDSLETIPKGPYRDSIESVLKLYNDAQAEISRIEGRTTEINGELARLNQAMQMAQRFARASTEEQKALGQEYERAYNNYSTNQTMDAQLRQEALINQQRMTQLQAPLIPYGLHNGADRQGEFFNSEEAQRQRQEASSRRAQLRAQGTQSFRQGDAARGPQPRPLAMLKRDNGGLAAGTPIPFTAGSAENIMVVSSGYLADRGNGRRHAGIDFAPEGGDRGNHQVAAVRTGRVTAATCTSGGWGCYVWVEDAQGNTAVYAHLTGAPQVKPGDVVSQGQPLGIMGNTGGSRGAHLHFSVLKPGARSEGNGANTLDPVAYINESRNESAAVLPRGLGMPPAGVTQPSGTPRSPQAPPPVRNAPVVVASSPPPTGAYILPDGSAYVYGGTIYAMSEEAASLVGTRRQAFQSSIRVPRNGQGGPQEPAYRPHNGPEVFHGANPVRNNRYSNDIADYGDIRQFNNPDNNYGYEALAQDSAFRRGLHELANELRIPAVWLADVMAFETGGSFNPGKANSVGCFGLIQFCPDNSGGSYKTVNGRRYSMQQLRNMSRAEQLNVVREYFREHMRYGGNKPYQHAHQVLYTVWGGGGRAWDNPANLRDVGDGDIRFHQYLNRLGEQAGRRYWTPYDQVSGEEVHDTMVAGCASCQQQAGLSPDNFIAHIGEASMLSMIG